MELMQERYKRVPGKPTFDGYAIAKGWSVAVGLWLVGTLIAAFITEVLPEGGASEAVSSAIGFWALVSTVSVLIAGVLGLLSALLLDRLMRPVQTPWKHVLVFALVFTLAGALLMSGITGSYLNALGVSCWMGLCAAVGRAVAFRKSGAFRRPTTWA